MNYEEKFEAILEEVKKGKEKPTLLLHCCCAPCSSACIERLLPFFKITLFFYNPNIQEDREYHLRKNELLRFAKQFSISVLEQGQDKDAFLKISKGLEQEKERGKRCYLCYQLRLFKTAKLAKEKGFTYFGTTLSVSPYKNVTWLNEIGKTLEEEVGVSYLYADFKKKNGYQRSIELAKKYKLYRQDYCGCIYSKKEREEKKKAVS